MSPELIITLFFVLLGVALFPLILHAQRRQDAQLAEWKAQELLDYLAWEVRSKDPRWAVRGEDGTVAKLSHMAKHADGNLEGLTVTRVVRNAAGEHFYWMWGTDGTRFHKHITQVNARILLKDAYVPPPAVASDAPQGASG